VHSTDDALGVSRLLVLLLCTKGPDIVFPVSKKHQEFLPLHRDLQDYD